MKDSHGTYDGRKPEPPYPTELLAAAPETLQQQRPAVPTEAAVAKLLEILKAHRLHYDDQEQAFNVVGALLADRDMWILDDAKQNANVGRLVAELSAIKSGDSVVVPREPTEEMLAAIRKCPDPAALVDLQTFDEHMRYSWRTMLTAAKGGK